MPGTVIQIEGVGNVEFPDGMKPEEINSAAHRLYTGAGAKQIEQNPPGVQPPPVQTGEGMNYASPIPTESLGPVAGPMLQPFGETYENLRRDPGFRKETGQGALAGLEGATAGAYPFAAAGGMAGSKIGRPVGEAVGQIANQSPENIDRLGTAGEIGGGILGGMAGEGLGRIGSALMENPGRVARTAVRGTLDQPVINKYAKAWEATDPNKTPYPVGTTEKIPVTMGKEKLPFKVGAQEKIPTISGEPTPYKVGAQERIPVRSPMKPFGAASGATEGGGQLPEVMVVPEPRPPLPGVPPGSMQSVPRADLAGHIMSGTPGALEAGQAIGMKPIILTPGAEFEMARPEAGTFSGRPPVAAAPSNLVQFPGASTPGEMLNGPQIMDRLGEINQNMGTGTGGLPPIRSGPNIWPEGYTSKEAVRDAQMFTGQRPGLKYMMSPLDETGMPKFNERGQRLGIEPIDAPKGTPQEINKVGHPDYNEKGQKLGVPPETEDVGKKVRAENPEPTREEVEEARKKKEKSE